MKKTLIAAALLAGFAGAAQAETSVTLYGIVDLGVGYQKIKGGPSGYDGSKFGLVSGNQNGSRWGLRGTEDLGGGTRAVFTLESGFEANNGRSAQGSRLFGRQSTVGLANDAWGQLDFGRQTNIGSKYFGSIDPFGAGFGQANIGAGFSALNTVRYDNMIQYQTPSYSGFQVGAGYSFNTGNGAASPNSFRTNENQRAITAGIRYANGPLNVAASYDQLNQVSSLDQEKVRSWNVGGSYDFEIVKLALAYGQTRNGIFGGQGLSPFSSSDSAGIPAAFGGSYRSTAGGFRANSWMVGATAPIGGASKLFGSWQRVDPRGNTELTGDDEKMNIYSLGYTYDLSKRTNLYTYASYSQDYAFVDGLKSTVGVVGVRHRF